MTAWTRLLAASSLAVGTAWQLISNPRTGVGVVVNDGVTVTLSDQATTVEVALAAVTLTLAPTAAAVEVVQAAAVAEVQDVRIALDASQNNIQLEIPI